MKTITRKAAVGLYGGNLTHLAKALGVTRQAVYFWPEDGDVPEWAYIKLRYVLKPEAFSAAGSLKPVQNSGAADGPLSHQAPAAKERGAAEATGLAIRPLKAA